MRIPSVLKRATMSTLLGVALVSASLTIGIGVASAAVVSSPPTSVAGSYIPGSNSVEVSWVAPTDNGGAAVTSYTATASPGGLSCSTNAPSTSCTISGLTYGDTYTFSATATNAAGQSGSSVPSAPINVVGPPGAPTSAVGSYIPGTTYVVVSWVAPTNNGGSAITNYTVTTSPGGATCTSSSTSCTITGLSVGQTYTFSVVAANIYGSGPSSGVSPPVTITAPTGVGPSAPTGVTATAIPGTESVTVYWSAANPNGGTITGYTATASPGGQNCSTTGALFCTITGLTQGQTYTFSVVAYGTNGTSSPSSPSAPVTVGGAVTGAPNPPTNAAVTYTTGASTAVVSWTAPVSNGGSAITGYEVYSVPGGAGCVTSGALSCTISSLVSGTTYSFYVEATNANGPSAPSNETTSITPVFGSTGGTPPVPTEVGVVYRTGTTQVTVNWNASAGAVGYVATSTPGGLTCTATTATTCVIKGLHQGGHYTFSVTAKGGSSNSVPSPQSSPATHVVTVPDITRSASARIVDGGRGVKISWAAPASNGGLGIYRYTVIWAPGKLACHTNGKAHSCTYYPPKISKIYHFAVRASNVQGTGHLSAWTHFVHLH
jgi:hypothetical protein